MSNVDLPDSISNLVEKLQIVQMSWQGIPIQLPRFAVYSVIDNPVFDRFIFRQGRKLAIVKLGRYQVPVIDPFRGDIITSPNHIVIISHCKGNRFGLYAYPADTVDNTEFHTHHKHSIHRIVRDYV